MIAIDKLYTHAKNISFKLKLPNFIKSLNELEEQYLSYKNSHSGDSLKILFGPSFSNYEPCFVHDRILSLALRLRGAKIIPIYCNQIQKTECGVYGGRWMGTTFKKACASCITTSWAMWPKKYFDPLKLSKFINTDEINQINKTMDRITDQNWFCYEENNIPFGRLAKDILVNNYMVGDYKLIDNHYNLGKAHLENLLLLQSAYSKILDKVKPDCVITNDTFYGMWNVLAELCIKRKIPFYSHWLGDRKNAWCYAYNDAAMSLDFKKVWKNFSSVPLTVTENTLISDWLENRGQRCDGIIDSTKPGIHQNVEFHKENLKNNKPKALLSANVIWDCAALNKQIIFKDMIDWIKNTIEWFKEHPQFELIIKPHPVEENKLVPITVETIKRGLEERCVVIPENVYLLDSNVNMSVYEFFPFVKVGLVHTTTVGMEMSALGMPVITSARSPYRGFGFTIDPINAKEYYEALENVLSGNFKCDITEIKEKSYQFIYFYRFHYYTKINIMDYEFKKQPKVLIDNIEQLLPGNNPPFDYIVDSILNGEPIISEDKWMPPTF